MRLVFLLLAILAVLFNFSAAQMGGMGGMGGGMGRGRGRGRNGIGMGYNMGYNMGMGGRRGRDVREQQGPIR